MAASTSSSSTTRFTKLRHDSSREDYDLWKDPMLRLLESRRLNGFVDGSLPPPPVINSQAHRERQWMDGVVKNSIFDALSPELVRVVVSRRTSRDVWLQLEAMFSPSTTSQPLPPPLFAILQEEDGGYKPMPSRLYKSALRGDWDATRAILEQDPEAVEARHYPSLKTALHIAVGTGKAFPYLRNLVRAMTVESLAVKDYLGTTALHVAATIGNLEAARILVDKHPDLLYTVDNVGVFPVLRAALSLHRPTLEFIISKITDPAPYAAADGVVLLKCLIDTSFFDIALNLIEKQPDLARRRHPAGYSALGTIALKFGAFESGARFNFWQRLIYSSIKLEKEAEPRAENPSCCTYIPREFARWRRVAWNLQNQAIRRLEQQAKWIHDQKVMHDQAVKLVKCVCMHMQELSEREAASIYKGATLKAAELGVHEVIEEIVEIFPEAIYSFENNSRRGLFHMAVENRCEKVFNLIYQMSDFKYEFASKRDNAGNSLLHKVAHLAPPHKLNLVSGAALQMQRELQWFKEVDKFVKVEDSHRLNHGGRTPEMIFTEEHSKLKAEGEKWMKETANSCSISAALIATVVFAAAITVPGGNAGSGYPLFGRSSAFIIFAVSDALSLFTSTTSLLMFLSILTSRYAEEDFLYALPKRLCIGLFTLFISILSMMAAFSSTIYLVFGQMNAWVLIPVAAFACLPVTSFVLLQFPLLVDVVSSTYGRGIFGKQSDRPFH